MLVLARKRNESIQIGEDIVIKVIQCGRGTVRLGVQAPGHVRVLRAELVDSEGFQQAPLNSSTAAIAEVQSVA